MKFIETSRENLIKLLRYITIQDKKELQHSFGSNYKERFITISIDACEKYFLADKDDNPLTIGGVETKNIDNLKVGRVWLISSIYFLKNKIKLLKFIRGKIEDFKKEHDILFNVIYKSNFDALKWLTKCGFKVIELKNKKYKLFYYTKGGTDFDLRYFTC